MPGNSAENFQPEIALVRREVETVVNLADIAPPLLEGVHWQLSQKGKVMHSGQGAWWSILPLLVCEAICSTNQHAIAAGAAVELAAAAGDAFDDIQDHEWEDSLVSVYGEEKAINIAIVLLMLSQRAVIRLHDQGVQPGAIVSVIEAISSGGLHSCAGQHRDLSYELEDDISTERYLEMIASKSAPLTEAACRVGAILATDDPQVVDAYGFFGRNVGIAAQIINDAQSITTTQWRRSDISKKKKTLPIIFAFNQADETNRQLLEHVYHPSTVITTELQHEAARAIIASGALYYSSVMAEKYRQLAAKAIATHANADSRLLALF